MDSATFSITVGEYPANSAQSLVTLHGLVVGIGVKINFAPYATSLDVSIVEQSDTQPDQDIFVKTGLTADGWYYPVAPINDQAGVAVADQYSMGIPVYGDVTIDVTNATPGDEVIITFRLE